MAPKECEEFTLGLKFCDSDTLATVMKYEHFKHDIIID
jgi:hypothetical protein